MLAILLPPDAEGLAAAQDRVEAFLQEAGAGDRIRYKVRLVLDELAANLGMHGQFAGPPPAARVALSLEDGVIHLAVEDAAAAFDPREAPAPGKPSLEGDAAGGLGLALVRHMATITGYRRLADGWNRLELRIDAG